MHTASKLVPSLYVTLFEPDRVLVRCAPTMKFYYVETALLPLWRRLNSLCFRQPLPPTQQVFMPVSEFADRMQSGCQLPHCVYPEDGPEYYYMQSQLARAMLQDVDLYSPPLSCLGRPGLAGGLSVLSDRDSYPMCLCSFIAIQHHLLAPFYPVYTWL